ncbi:MAG: hypothetical protein HY774_01200 [Acidobacteria bacterium]|nr:hypothetical protein [Acidobacteriota bacterium]
MSHRNNPPVLPHLFVYVRTVLLNFFLVVVGVCLFSSPTLAQSVADDFNPGADGTVQTMAVQPDGKILVGGGFGSLGGQPQANIGRLNPDGTLDMMFRPVVSGPVLALAVQLDGKILVGGAFVFINGVVCPGLGRLNPDGTLDQTFTSPQSLSIFAIVLQPDEKIVIGGDFTFVAGQPAQRIVRLNSDGTRDTSFNSSANDLIWTLGLQADGKILVGGDFSMLGGQPCSRIGRLNLDGTLDMSFTASADSTVRTVLVQPDGKIVVGGAFTTLSGQPRNRIGRLNLDGTVDMTFNPGADGPIVSLAIQTDGKILAGGNTFSTLGGQPRFGIGRLETDGTIDPMFNPGAFGIVNSLAIQTDGKVIVGGTFFLLGGQPRNLIGRVTNPDAAIESLWPNPFGTTLTWQRSGSSPEVQRVLFEQSTDGINFTPLGNGTRIAGGWQLTGLTIPFEQLLTLRARGAGTVASSGSHSLYESVVNVFLICARPATVSGGATICPGDTSTVTVTVTGGVGPYTVTLNNGGGTQTGNGPVFTFPVSPTSTTIYSLSGSDSTGCAILGTGSATVTVTPTPTVNPVTPPTICGGTSTNIPLNSTPGGATLSWTIGPVTGTVTGQAAGSGNTIAQTLNGSGTVTYLVSATLNGCPGSPTSIVQTVEPRATANAGPDQVVCVSSPAVTLAGVIGGSASNGTWSGGAGVFNPGPGTLNAMYTPSAGEIAAGSVTLTLTTDDPAGVCGAGTDTMTISILDCTVSSLLMVADTTNNRVQRFDGTTWTVIGVGTVGSGNGQFRTPEAVAFDSTGRIYVADTGNNRIQWSTDAGTTWVNFATLGSAPNQVRAPQGLALDVAGNLYVSDTGNGRVLRFNGGIPGTGVVIASNGIASGQVGSPRGLAIDSAFRLFIADESNSRILRISNANTVLIATTGTVIATKGTGLNQVMNPQGLALEPTGTLYVADTGNSRVLRWINANPNNSSTMALTGSQLGQVNRPEGVTVKFFQSGSFAGNLLLVVGDTLNNRIQGRFLPTGQWNLIGAPNGPGTTVGRFRNPSKLQ